MYPVCFRLLSWLNFNFLQWARLRGAAYCVIRSSLRNSITECSASIISALVKAECDAAMIQCNQGKKKLCSVLCVFMI